MKINIIMADQLMVGKSHMDVAHDNLICSHAPCSSEVDKAIYCALEDVSHSW